MLQGAIETFHVLCGQWSSMLLECMALTFVDLLMTLPLAYVSDKYGRKVVFSLNIFSLFVMWATIVLIGWTGEALAISATAIAPIFTLLGGGDCVFQSTVASTIEDLAPNQKFRTQLFAYTSSVGYVTTLTAPALAAYTMSINLWIPFGVGLSLLVFALPIASILPGKNLASIIQAPQSQIAEESAPLIVGNEARGESIPACNSTQHISFYSRGLNHVTTLLHSVLDRQRFQLLVGIFFLASFASSNSPLLVQYISKRYHWTFSQAGYLLSAKAVVNVTLLIIIVPSLVQIAANRFSMSPRRINIIAAEISIIISVIGVFVIAISPNMRLLIPGKLLNQ
jgi:MFS family permease